MWKAAPSNIPSITSVTGITGARPQTCEPKAADPKTSPKTHLPEADDAGDAHHLPFHASSARTGSAARCGSPIELRSSLAPKDQGGNLTQPFEGLPPSAADPLPWIEVARLLSTVGNGFICSGVWLFPVLSAHGDACRSSSARYHESMVSYRGNPVHRTASPLLLEFASCYWSWRQQIA